MTNTELSAPIYLLGEVADAVQVNPITVASYIKRGFVVFGGGDRAGFGTGSRRRFTLRRIYQVAILARLAEMGVPLEAASEASIRFTDIAAETWCGRKARGALVEEGAPPDPDCADLREPGALFRGGETYLVLLKTDDGFRSELWRITDQPFGGVAIGAGVFLNVGEVVRTVRRRLGIAATAAA